MSSPSGSRLEITLDESASFARLSGDFNPLHVDPVLARRTPFGGTVVHGIHALLKALDQMDGGTAPEGLQPVAIACTFHSPIPTGAPAQVSASRDAASGRLKVLAELEGRLAFSATVDCGPGRTGSQGTYVDADFEPASPVVREDLASLAPDGAVPLKLRSARMAGLFPRLARTLGPDWIANLIGTTQIVGMACPGMHSIFSGVRLQRSDAAAGNEPAQMRYTITRKDDRFRLVRLGIASDGFEGSIEALVRPPPVRQLALAEVARTVAGDAFAGQRALVIGASRGLGEVAAKLLVAGGADVTLTYSSGREDAERIVSEAAAAGLRCAALHLDVESFRDSDAAKALAEADYSHVYFFASPHIARNATDRWRHDLFERFCRIYVGAFAAVAEVILAGAQARHRPPARFFYPSTVFLDRPEKGFAEYGAAKAAGESLCGYLETLHGTSFARPRLPRMRTDQTSGLGDSLTLEPLAVMRPLLAELHGGSPDCSPG